MKVLIADKFEPSGIEGLEAAGCRVIYHPDLRDASLVDAIRSSGADILIVRSTVVTEEMMAAGKLSLIVRAGAGYNNIDVKAASRRGIFVSNCPGQNSAAVAELAFGLILSLDRRIPDNVAALRAGKWNKGEFSKASGLSGRTLGLLGFGNIGQEMAKRAQAFGMNLVIWSEIGVALGRDGLPADLPILIRLRPSGDSLIEPNVEIAKSPAEVAEKSDILSVHLALNAKTRGLIGADVLGRMKPGSLFVNTARAEVVDYQALEAAVRENGLRVALDVYPREPAGSAGEFDDPLLHLPNVYGTHHIGASTAQAQEAIAAETVRIVHAYLDKGRVDHVVNLAHPSPASFTLVIRHRNRPGVLAAVFARLRDAGINVQETENVVFEGADAAVVRINLDAEPARTLLAGIREGNEHVLDLRVIALGTRR